MKNCKTLLTALLFSSLLFQGCEEPEEKHPPVIGSAVSISIDDKQAEMAPSTQALNQVSHTIATILKVQLNEISQQEVSASGQEIFYCDISGLKQWENSSTLHINYEACQTQEHQQNGEIELTYEKTQEAWQYPQSVKLLVKEAYTFNDIVLQKNFIVESKVLYNEDKSLNKISLKINGLLSVDYQTLKFENFEQDSIF